MEQERGREREKKFLCEFLINVIWRVVSWVLSFVSWICCSLLCIHNILSGKPSSHRWMKLKMYENFLLIWLKSCSFFDLSIFSLSLSLSEYCENIYKVCLYFNLKGNVHSNSFSTRFYRNFFQVFLCKFLFLFCRIIFIFILISYFTFCLRKCFFSLFTENFIAIFIYVRWMTRKKEYINGSR